MKKAVQFANKYQVIEINHSVVHQLPSTFNNFTTYSLAILSKNYSLVQTTDSKGIHITMIWIYQNNKTGPSYLEILVNNKL